MPETLDEKALRYVGERRLVIEYVGGETVRARCYGGGDVYEVGWRGGEWYCTCPATTPRCCHVRALALVVRRHEKAEAA
jgi:hypothetical protein